MKKVFLIHGFGGVPNGGWLPWLMVKLGKENIYACALPMLNANEPKVDEWVKMINDIIGEGSKENIYLVGHSLGAPAVLRYLESLNETEKIGGVVLISGLIEPLDTDNLNSELRKIDNFVIPEINFEKIKNIPQKSIVIHGTQDTVVPFSHAEKIAKGIGCQIVKVEGGDHFSQKTEPICYELPEALEVIVNMVK